MPGTSHGTLHGSNARDTARVKSPWAWWPEHLSVVTVTKCFLPMPHERDEGGHEEEDWQCARRPRRRLGSCMGRPELPDAIKDEKDDTPVAELPSSQATMHKCTVSNLREDGGTSTGSQKSGNGSSSPLSWTRP